MITGIKNPGGAAEVQSRIPVMWDWPDNHQQGWVGNVLYMDGDDLLSIPELLRKAVAPRVKRKIVYVDFEHLDE